MPRTRSQQSDRLACFIMYAKSQTRHAPRYDPLHNPNLCLVLQLLLDLATGLDALQYALTVLVELQLGDDDLGWVDADWD